MATQGATAIASGNSVNYNYEKNRLRSFQLWPYPNVVNPNELAKSGFYSTGFYMETQCNWCHTTISDWQIGDQVMARHKRSDPFCQFIANPNGCGNISLESDGNNELINNSNSDSVGNTASSNNGSNRPSNNDTVAAAATSSNVDNYSSTNNTSGLHSTTDSRSLSSSNGESTSGEQRQRSQQQRQQPLIGNLENPQIDLKVESNRLASFKNWPNPNVSPQSLAKAGFYYFNKSDHVQCAWCKGVIGKWEKGDDAFKEHDRFFPNCPRVQLGPLIETTIIDNNSLHLSRELGIQEICPPKSAKYSCLDARMRTYSRWPIPDIQNPVILAQAGFYYQEIEDQVRCFHCHGGLRSWQKEDDPWFEHAKWFPYCSFLKLAKGPNFVSQICGLGRSQRSQSNSNENTANNQEQNLRQATLTSEPVINLDDAMQTEPVQRALEMGLNEGRIMSATRRYLEANGKPFDTTEELVEAVLEGQVDEEDDANGPEPSSSIVREVSIILNNIFNPRNQSQISVEVGSGYDFDDIGDFHGAGEGSSSINYFNDRSITDSSTNIVSNIDRNRQSSTTNNDSQSNTSNLTHDNSNSDVNSVQKAQQSPKETNVDEASIENNEVNKTKPPLNEQQSLEEENRKLKDARTCKVCMDDEVGVVFLPCGHLVTCFQCAPGVTVCPLCRSTIKGFVRTFLS